MIGGEQSRDLSAPSDWCSPGAVRLHPPHQHRGHLRRLRGSVDTSSVDTSSVDTSVFRYNAPSCLLCAGLWCGGRRHGADGAPASHAVSDGTMMMIMKKIKIMMMMMKPLQVGLDHPGWPDYTHGRAVFNAEEEDPAQTGWGSCYKASITCCSRYIDILDILYVSIYRVVSRARWRGRCGRPW